MKVSLTPEMERFLEEKVSTGEYRNISEVVGEGLKLLQAREGRPGFMVESKAELTAKIREGLAALDREEYSDLSVAQIISEGKKRLATRRKNG